jgi:teichoic acid transport system permease protein
MLGLFAFRFVANAVTDAARSVVGGGRLILNTAFPRALLPFSSVVQSFIQFLPTVLVYAILHVVTGLPVGLHLLWTIPILALLAVVAFGVSLLAATAQVYFRDVASFLPYAMRIWMYASPVLYYAEEVPHRFKVILTANPLFPLLGSLSDVVTRGETPSARFLAEGVAWAIVVVVVGAVVFVSREREFAVRL